MGQSQPQTSARQAERAVLVVEDEVLVRILISDELRDRGVRVIEADNADQALELMAVDPAVALVFTDVRMPGTLDGLELAHRIARDYPHVQTVVTSGHLAGCEVPAETRFFSKPYPLCQVAEQLIESLEEADKRPAEQSG